MKQKIIIQDGFWKPRMELNKAQAIISQWNRYEACGTIGNFELLASGIKEGRRGLFYVDSDLHKWADAASRIIAYERDKNIEILINRYISLIKRTQEPDGYIYTWNQMLFPGIRWVNLRIEHELYCMGHFIEAGISHFQATGSKQLLTLAEKTANLIVDEFLEDPAARAPGHQEIEIALLRLFEITGEARYRKTAQAFLLRRGTKPFQGFKLLLEYPAHIKRNRSLGINKAGFDIQETRHNNEPPCMSLRFLLSVLTGRYQQMHKPFSRQRIPWGHSVRWAYGMFAAALLCRTGYGNAKLLELMKANWKSLIREKTYITGGIGSLPQIEGFGRSYELNNRYSYSETCAAIGALWWNRVLGELTGDARHADMVERLLYNGCAVGISLDGTSYAYRNPLESSGEPARHEWYDTACCPSNLSRLWAEIPELISRMNDDCLVIDQYISCHADFKTAGVKAVIKSEFPWSGEVTVSISAENPLRLKLRIPGWAEKYQISMNNEILLKGEGSPEINYETTMEQAFYQEIQIPEGEKNEIKVSLPMNVRTNRSGYRVKTNRGKISVSRGPLIYCLEMNQLPEEPLLPGNLKLDFNSGLFNEKIGILQNETHLMVPYFAWGNRGGLYMRVWV